MYSLLSPQQRASGPERSTCGAECWTAGTEASWQRLEQPPPQTCPTDHTALRRQRDEQLLHWDWLTPPPASPSCSGTWDCVCVYIIMNHAVASNLRFVEEMQEGKTYTILQVYTHDVQIACTPIAWLTSLNNHSYVSCCTNVFFTDLVACPYQGNRPI